MGRVRVRDAATVGAQLLDGLLAGDGRAVDLLRTAFQRRDNDWAAHRLHDAERSQQDGERERDGQQDPHDGAHEVGPEVADRLSLVTAEAADQGDRHRHAYRGGDEVLDRQTTHLDEVAHRRLAARSSASWCSSRS